MTRSLVLGTATATVAAMLATVIAAELIGMALGPARPGGRRLEAARTRSAATDASFGTVKRVNAGVLNVGYMDALGIEKAVLAACDWDARAADSIAAIWPERALVVSSPRSW
jgi:hypothetical protein